MMRATPYCSVRPSAMSAYMPPSTRPGRRMSNISMDQRPVRKAAGEPPELMARLRPEALLPLRLGHDRRARPGKRRRRKPVKLAVLPLADAPHLLQQTVLELHLADDRIE